MKLAESTAEVIKAVVEAVLTEFGIENLQLISLTSDNAANVEKVSLRFL